MRAADWQAGSVQRWLAEVQERRYVRVESGNAKTSLLERAVGQYQGNGQRYRARFSSVYVHELGDGGPLFIRRRRW